MTDNLYDLEVNVDLKSELAWNDAKEVSDFALFQTTGKYLSDIEIKVIQAAWEDKTYDQMAMTYGYSAEYLNKDIGNKLWHKLSKALEEKVTKKNFKAALKRAWEKKINSSTLGNIKSQISPPIRQLPFPESSVPPNSSLYIERNNIENLCDQTILKPGSLIRIKAPKLMGKTSLINRLMANTKIHKYQIVYLDFSSINSEILTKLDKLLRWLCCIVGRQLKLENKLDDYWDSEILGSNDNCTFYFEEYLLNQVDSLILGLDNIDKIFSHANVIEDLLGMLRSWHEKGKISQVWGKLRLVLAHSTEVYVPLDINQSPFNAGVPIELGEFNHQQVKQLVSIHNLSWNETEINQLMKLVGGHPYLIRLAMYQVSCGNLTLEQLLQNAVTEAGIYSNHLRGYLEVLQKSPKLVEAFKIVVDSPKPVELDSMHIYKLHSMGLVQRHDNHVIPRCNLYQEYFQRVLN
ncbi:MAG: AAA-like domain-containing protein [Cyanobacteria bacterium P01_A01_bin.84]